MINIAQVTPDNYFPVISGNTFVADNFGSIAQRFGKSLIFIDNKSDKEYSKTIHGNTVININGTEEQVSDKIKKILRKDDIQILLFHDYTYPKIRPLINRSMGNVKKIAIMHFYDPSVVEDVDILDAVIVFQKKHLEMYRNISDKEIFHYVPHTVSNFFHLNKTKRPGGSVIYAGRVMKEKGPHLLIPKINELGINRYTIVGEIKPQEYRQFIEEEIDRHNVRDKVCLIKNFVGKKELAELFNSHETFFLGSHDDCYSLVLQEALACGMSAVVKSIDHAYYWAESLISEFKEEIDIKEAYKKSKKSLEERVLTADFIRKEHDETVVFDHFEAVVEKVLFDKDSNIRKLRW